MTISLFYQFGPTKEVPQKQNLNATASFFSAAVTPPSTLASTSLYADHCATLLTWVHTLTQSPTRHPSWWFCPLLNWISEFTPLYLADSSDTKASRPVVVLCFWIRPHQTNCQTQGCNTALLINTSST